MSKAPKLYPMETAPKDGTLILVKVKDRGYYVEVVWGVYVQYDESDKFTISENQYWIAVDGGSRVDAEFWMYAPDWLRLREVHTKK